MRSHLGIAFGVMAIVALSFSGCHKDKENDNVPKGALMLHLHNYIGTQEVDAYNITYTNDDGRKISISLAQFYVSDIRLVKADGSLYTINDTIVLKVQEKEAYLVAKIPAGDYKTIYFKVGLDSATNLQWPSANRELNHPEMWFDTDAQPEGYVYLNVQGKIDTTADASGLEADMQPFKFRIGTNKQLAEVQMPEHPFTVTSGQSQFIHMYADITKLFNGIQLSDPTQLNINTTWDNNSLPAANTVSSNIPGMFVYE